MSMTPRYKCIDCCEIIREENKNSSVCADCQTRRDERKAHIEECNKTRVSREDGIRMFIDMERLRLNSLTKEKLIELAISRTSCELGGLDDVALTNRLGGLADIKIKIRYNQ
jgi:hypothetical protein